MGKATQRRRAGRNKRFGPGARAMMPFHRPLGMEWLEQRRLLSIGCTLEAETPLIEDHLLCSSADELVIGPKDTLSGNRTVVGNVVNQGVVSPGNSPGIINVAGDLTISGTTLIEIGGLTPGPGDPVTDNGYDQINVNYNLILGGTLEIVLINNFSPSVGETFDILNYGLVEGDLTGTFDTASGMFGFGDRSLYFEIVHDSVNKVIQLQVKETLGGGNITSGTQAINDLLGEYYSEYFTSIPATSIPGDLTIDQFVNLQGTFVFQIEPLANLTVVDDAQTFSGVGMKTLSISGANVRGFAGYGGPYRAEDLNGDGNLSWSFKTGSGPSEGRMVTAISTNPTVLVRRFLSNRDRHDPYVLSRWDE